MRRTCKTEYSTCTFRYLATTGACGDRARMFGHSQPRRLHPRLEPGGQVVHVAKNSMRLCMRKREREKRKRTHIHPAFFHRKPTANLRVSSRQRNWPPPTGNFKQLLLDTLNFEKFPYVNFLAEHEQAARDLLKVSLRNVC